jgi:plastocyanin
LAAALAFGWAPVSGAQTAVEGMVRLLPAVSVAPTVSRYTPNTPAPGPPDPPAAVVYLEGSFPSRTNAVARMEQRRYQFSPGVLAIQRGTRVEFPNLDDAYHNVFSYSKAKRFDLGRYRKGETPASQVFDQPGVVKLYCEIHQHMKAVILVLDTPYFVTTEQGRYKLDLKGVPAGRYALKAWIDEKTTWERMIEVKAGAVTRMDFPENNRP